MPSVTRIILIVVALMICVGIPAGLIILAVAIPQYNKARMNATEMMAISEIQTISKAEIQYSSQFGRYAKLIELGPPSLGTGLGAGAAGLIPVNLATGYSGGYNFTLSQTLSGYALSAVPKAFNSTGRRTFYSDQTDVVHQNWGRDPATANSPEMK